MNKPKYKYLIYRILKNFRYPHYNYIRVYYFENVKLISLVLRKNIDVPYAKISVNFFETGIATEVYKTKLEPFCKTYNITNDMIEHIKHDEIINKIRIDFDNSIKEKELIKN